jgi:hypothetical protein
VTLEEVALFCRKHGISRYWGSAGTDERVEIEFFPSLAAVPSLPDAAADTVMVTRKLGKDGLTAEQQLENYGKVIDADD